MKKTISSKHTVITKFLIPILWIGGFGLKTITSFYYEGLAINGIKFLIITIIGALFLSISKSFSVKQVKIDENNLYISNFIKEIKVNKKNITNITERKFTYQKRVWIHFKQPTEFGRKIIFVPKQRWYLFHSSHPIVSELKKYANLRRNNY